MKSNFSGIKPLIVDENEEFSAFDKLPKTLRKALNETAFKWSAKELEDVRKSRGITHHNIAKFLAEQDRQTINRTVYDTWGSEYISIVYADKHL